MNRGYGLLFSGMFAMAFIALAILFTPANAATVASAGYPYPNPTSTSYPNPTTTPEAYPRPSSTGATRYNFGWCNTFDGITVCYNYDGVFNIVRTPSGVLSYSGHAHNIATYTDANGAIIYRNEGRYSYQNLAKDGVLKVFGSHSINTFQYGPRICTGKVDFRFAGDELRHYNSSFSCT